MNKIISFVLSLIILTLSLQFKIQGQTIEQKLVVIQNDQTIGGNFRVQVQVKGTSLPAANTLGSATIDVQFDTTHLTYVNATAWAFGSSLGYSRSATRTLGNSFIRFGVTGLGVNENGGGDPAGFDIENTYTSWVQLNFTIQSLTTSSLIINNSTNAIGLYQNHSNEPRNGVIINQTLTAPENINVALPVELSSFTGKVVDGKKVDLNWITKTEVNNYGFNIERRIKDGEWNNIGFVEGQGNSNSPKTYKFIDNNLFSGGSNFQYRLKQVDNDGQFKYSDVVEVEIVPTKFELLQNYPNPFNPSTTIRFSLPVATQLKINIYNMLGQLVQTLAEGKYEAGYYKVTFDASGLPSGAYVYRIESSEYTQVMKMVLMK